MSEWLSDLKFGYCSDGWWLNQQFCCWEIEGEEVDGCDSWRPWSDVTLARWFIFVLFAVSGLLCIKYAHCLIHLSLDYVFFYCCASRTVYSEIRCRLWDFGNQMHSCWFRHERVPRICHLRHQKYDIGALVRHLGAEYF